MNFDKANMVDVELGVFAINNWYLLPDWEGRTVNFTGKLEIVVRGPRAVGSNND